MRTRPDFGRLNAITRLISVLLPEPLDPTSAVVVPAGARKLTPCRTGTPSLYSKVTSSKAHLAVDRRRAARGRSSSASSVRISMQLVDAVEAGEGLADLRADRRDLHDRRGHQAGEQDVGDEVADRHLAGEDGAAADDDHDQADGADDDRAEGGDARDRGDRLRDVAEQPVNAGREHQLFALLRGVGLDDADAADRLGQPSGHFGVDLAALAEDRTDRPERVPHRRAERQQHDERDERERRVQIEEDHDAPRARSRRCRRAGPGRCRRDCGSLRRRS